MSSQRKPMGFKHLGQRMALAFGLVVLLMAGLTGIALQRIDAMATALKALSVETVGRGALLRELDQMAADHGALIRTLAASVSSANAETYQKLVGQVKQTHEGVAKARAMLAGQEGAALVDAIERDAKAVFVLLDAAQKDGGDRGPAAIAFSARVLYLQDIATWMPKLEAWRASSRKLVEWDEAEGRALAQASAGLGDTARLILMAGAALATALAAGLGWWLTRNVTRGVHAAVKEARRMGEHDLSQPIRHDRADEIGQLLDTLETLRTRQAELTRHVADASRAVLQAAREIASGSNDLSARSEQAAAIMQRTATAIDGLAESLADTSSAAQQADALTGTARQEAGEGQAVVSSAVTTMESVNDSSRRIADITGLIDGISFQTNILALNAAVEAARAGEQGRGFAVVATEVRQLASRSAQAAKEIKVLIASSQEEVAKGSRQVTLAGSSTQNIVGSIEQVTGIVGVISRNAQSQLAAVDGTRGAVRDLESVAQHNAAMAEQTAAAAQSLTQQADRMTQLVSRFRTEETAGV